MKRMPKNIRDSYNFYKKTMYLDRNIFGTTYIELYLKSNLFSDFHLVYYKYSYGNDYDEYIVNNFKKFQNIFVINYTSLSFFKRISNDYKDARKLTNNKKMSELQKEFYNFMKTTIEKHELQKQINSNYGVNKPKRRKRVI